MKINIYLLSVVFIINFYLFYCTQLTPRSFIERFAATVTNTGAYTVIPVVDSKLLHISFHYNRLFHSLNILGGIPGDVVEKLKREKSEDFLNTIIHSTPTLDKTQHSMGFLTVCMHADSTDNNIKFEMLFTPKLLSEFTPKAGLLHSEHTSEEVSLVVDVFPFQRKHPGAKHVHWPEERKFIEQSRGALSVETLLSRRLAGGDTALLEGLTSSFAVIEEGALVTAGEDLVLDGSMCDILLQVCREQGMPIRREPPLVSRAHLWSSAFLISSSRLMSPISSINVEPLALHPDSATDEQFKTLKEAFLLKIRTSKDIWCPVSSNMSAATESLLCGKGK